MFVAQDRCLAAKGNNPEIRQSARLKKENENLIKHI